MPAPQTRRLLATTAAVGVASSMLIASLLTAPSSSAAGTSGDPSAAQRWMISQLKNGAVPGFDPDHPDWGLTIDTLWALQATGAPSAAIAKTWNAVSSHAGDYAMPVYGGTAYVTAGATAKVLLAAATMGSGPVLKQHDGASINILNETVALVNEKAGFEKGRLKDPEASGPDSTNIFSQSLAVLGLSAYDVQKTTHRQVLQDTVDFLQKQQCSAGYFRMFYNDGLTCDAARPKGEGAPDNDGTAMGLQALLAAKRAGLTVPQSAIDRATSFLISVQKPDGSFGGGVSTEGANSNSTGLVAAALQGAGKTEAAARAGAWVANLQAVAPKITGTALAKDVGAIAYDKTSFDSALTDGIGTLLGVWQRATPQAVFALKRVPFIDLVPAGAMPPVITPPTSTPPTTPAKPKPSGTSTSTPTKKPTTPAPRPSSTTATAPSAAAQPKGATTAGDVVSGVLVRGAAKETATGGNPFQVQSPAQQAAELGSFNTSAPAASAPTSTAPSTSTPATDTAATPAPTTPAATNVAAAPRAKAADGGTNWWPLAGAIGVGGLAGAGFLLWPRSGKVRD